MYTSVSYLEAAHTSESWWALSYTYLFSPSLYWELIYWYGLPQEEEQTQCVLMGIGRQR
jgi:hypothetical protein